MTEAVKKDNSWWKRWFVQPITRQLTQGISPEKLGWTIAAGIVIGIFPIMGTTTIICFFAAWLFKLNQPIIQVACHAVYALHLGLILVFIRTGQWIFGAEPISLSIRQFIKQFMDDPLKFTQDFGVAALQGIAAWAVIAPVLIILIKAISTPILERLAQRIRRGKEVIE
ncbi:DUF2062 domain-containing protein [Akkermansiaceae bacterium]|nr:DUF2062 domain-containing protein [Akkermansiaceae bacterium]